MNITLKNGKTIKLEFTPIVLEYLSDYEGGIEELKKDIENGNTMYVANHIVYSILCANLEEELTYKQALSLVNVLDVERIIDFVNQQDITTTQKSQNRKRH